MCVNQLQRDTVLVTDVAGRVETALAEHWRVEGSGLGEQIESLRRHRGVAGKVIGMLHYLRQERNRVIHHPRRELGDRTKFQRFAEDVLPQIEKSSSPDDLGRRLSQEIESLFADLWSDVGDAGDLDSLARQIEAGLPSLDSVLKPR